MQRLSAAAALVWLTLAGAAQARDDAATRGRATAVGKGCMACHLAPDVRFPRGLTGPPLSGMGERVVIAGVLPNTPENMARWLKDPQAVKRGDAMPAVGLTDSQARDVTAWLESLRSGR